MKGKMLLLLAAVLAGIGFLFMLPGVLGLYDDIDEAMIQPITDNSTSVYESAEGDVPSYNSLDYLIMHNLPYLCYGGAIICVIVGLGKGEEEI